MSDELARTILFAMRIVGFLILVGGGLLALWFIAMVVFEHVKMRWRSK